MKRWLRWAKALVGDIKFAWRYRGYQIYVEHFPVSAWVLRTYIRRHGEVDWYAIRKEK